MPTTLIRHATCILPDGPCDVDLLVDAGKIARIDPPIGTRVDATVDAAGLFLLPGVVDDQVHFRDPGHTHKEDLSSGSMACATGGVTTYLDMPNTDPPTITCAALERKLEEGARKSLVNYGFYMGATSENLAELQAAERTPGIKIFIGSSTGTLLVDQQEALEQIFAGTTLPITAHCEDEERIRANSSRMTGDIDVSDHSRIRDREAAVIATRRAIDLAHRHAHRFHVLHVSTADEVDLLRDHRGLVTSEVCLHHLYFTEDDYPRLGTLVQANPSIKTAADCDALMAALREGVIPVIATDHAPHTIEEKAAAYPASPSGVPAVENGLSLMLNQVSRGRCTIEEVVSWMCDAPARTWDMVGKGRLEEGYDADLVLVDLDKTVEIRNEDQVSRCGWSPWHGYTVTGVPVQTWVMGRCVYAEGRVDPSVRGEEVIFDHARGGYWSTLDAAVGSG